MAYYPGHPLNYVEYELETDEEEYYEPTSSEDDLPKSDYDYEPEVKKRSTNKRSYAECTTQRKQKKVKGARLDKKIENNKSKKKGKDIKFSEPQEKEACEETCANKSASMARKEKLERRWKMLRCEEMELELRKLELMSTQLRIILDVMKSIDPTLPMP